MTVALCGSKWQTVTANHPKNCDQAGDGEDLHGACMIDNDDSRDCLKLVPWLRHQMMRMEDGMKGPRGFRFQPQVTNIRVRNWVGELTCENVLVSDHATVVDGQTGHCHQKDERGGCKHPCRVAWVESSGIEDTGRIKERVEVAVRVVARRRKHFVCHFSVRLFVNTKSCVIVQGRFNESTVRILQSYWGYYWCRCLSVGSILIFGSLKVHLSTVCAQHHLIQNSNSGRLAVAVWLPTSDFSSFRIFVVPWKLKRTDNRK